MRKDETTTVHCSRPFVGRGPEGGIQNMYESRLLCERERTGHLASQVYRRIPANIIEVRRINYTQQLGLGRNTHGQGGVTTLPYGFNSRYSSSDSVAKWEGKGVQNPDSSCSNPTRVFVFMW